MAGGSDSEAAVDRLGGASMAAKYVATILLRDSARAFEDASAKRAAEAEAAANNPSDDLFDDQSAEAAEHQDGDDAGGALCMDKYTQPRRIDRKIALACH